MSKIIKAPCTFAVLPLMCKLIRVETAEVKGYGRVMEMINDGDAEIATIEMEKYDEIG